MGTDGDRECRQASRRLSRGRAAEEGRAATLITATVRSAPGTIQVAVHDLSSGGCRIAADVRLEVGFVALRLPGLEGLTGKIVWVEDDQGGLSFRPKLHPAVLEHFVRSNPPSGT